MTATTTASTELAANRRDIRPGRIIAWTLLFIGGLIMITPLLFMFSTSLKTSGQVYDLRLIPAAPTLDNYVRVLSDGRFMQCRIDRCERGQINDAAKTDVLPYFRPDINRFEIGRVGHEMDRIHPEHAEQKIERTGSRRQKLQNDA